MDRSIIPYCFVLLVACGESAGPEAPVLGNASFTTAEDTPISVTVGVTASEPGAVALTVVTPPDRGTLTGDGPTWTYAPEPDFAGTDTVLVRGEDAHGSGMATVTIVVTPVNDAPVASPDSVATGFDAPLTVAQATLVANDTDIDSETLTVTAVASAPDGHGAPVLSGSDVVFTPEAGFEGTASFSYTVSDGELTAQGTVTVSVGVDHPPVAGDDVAATAEDTPLTIADATLLANDTEPDMQALAVAAVGNPSHGAVTHQGGEVTFVPEAGFNGTAGFEYTVTDGLMTDVGAVVVTVGSVNDGPVVTASNGAATYVENAVAVAVDPGVAVADADSTSLAGATVQVSTGCVAAQDLLELASPPGGISVTGYDAATCTLSLTGPAVIADYQAALRAVTYRNTSDAPTTAARVVRLAVDDGEAAGNTGSDTRALAVTAVDDSPVAVDDTPTVAEDAAATAVTVLANDTDIDGGPISIAAVTQPSNGTVAITGGGTGLTYAPDAGYCNSPPGTEADVFTYTLAPGGSVGDVAVSVTCDVAPVAVNDAATVDQNSTNNSLDVLANDTDIDGGPRQVVSVTQPAHGVTAVGGGGSSVTYTPASGYCNDAPNAPPDSFTYTLNGGSSASVAVDVTCLCGLEQATDFVVGTN